MRHKFARVKVKIGANTKLNEENEVILFYSLKKDKILRGIRTITNVIK